MPNPRPKPVPNRPRSTALLDRVRATLASHPRAPRGATQIASPRRAGDKAAR
jgi:hypothetical protein